MAYVGILQSLGEIMITDPKHRTWANYVLDWMKEAGNKIRDEYNDQENYLRFFTIGQKHHRWDYFTFVDGDILIGWNGIPYSFRIYSKELYVQRMG
jgi:hypothetical protein